MLGIKTMGDQAIFAIYTNESFVFACPGFLPVYNVVSLFCITGDLVVIA